MASNSAESQHRRKLSGAPPLADDAYPAEVQASLERHAAAAAEAAEEKAPLLPAPRLGGAAAWVRRSPSDVALWLLVLVCLRGVVHPSGWLPPFPRALQLVPLHGLLDDDTQRDAFAPAPPGVRKVVISTNIAESSVTVPDVRFVIDFGFEKLPWFSPTTNTQALLLKLCSRASAAQRASRA